MGGVLAEAGHDITLVTRNAAHVDAINAVGLTLRSEGRDRVVRLFSALDTEGMRPVDLVVVLVKSRDTEAAMSAARGIVGASTVVMSLQNGLGQEVLLSDIVGRDHVLAGKTYVGGVMLAPGLVTAGTLGKETIVGELDGSVSQRVQNIAAVFTRAGLATRVSPNIMGAMWDKLLVNVATGAVAAITGLPYGALYSIPEIEKLAIAAVGEAMAVAQAKGILMATTDPRVPWLKASEGLPTTFRTSMLQSLDKGAPTEIDFINGAVVRAGKHNGVLTPVNETLVGLIKGIEARMGLTVSSTLAASLSSQGG
jgi:2-dehydropantoate 2-reductase